MKRIIFTTFLCFSFAGVGFSKGVYIASGEWEPFFSKNLLHDGVTTRIVKESFANAGITGVNIEYKSWKRAYALVKDASKVKEKKDDRFIATPGWNKNKDRENDFCFAGPIAKSVTAVFYHKDRPIKLTTLKDLYKKKAGTIHGFVYTPELKKLFDDKIIESYPVAKEQLNFKKLQAGKIDFAIAELDVGYDVLTTHFKKEMSQKPPAFSHTKHNIAKQDLYVLFSKKHKDGVATCNAFQKGLDKLIADGKVAAYYKESRLGKYKKK